MIRKQLTLDMMFKIIGSAASVALVFVVLLIGLTMWAIKQSTERTACLHSATSVADCGSASWVEGVLRRAVGPKIN